MSLECELGGEKKHRYESEIEKKNRIVILMDVLEVEKD